jgi:amphi-Trp domain-containing protein
MSRSGRKTNNPRLPEIRSTEVEMGKHEGMDHHFEDGKIFAKGALGRGQAVGFIENLLERIREGEVVIQSGRDEVTLTPGDLLDVEVKAGRRGGRQKLSLELSWEHAPATGVVHSAGEHAEEGESCVSEQRRRMWEAEEEQEDETERRFVMELFLGCDPGETTRCSTC